MRAGTFKLKENWIIKTVKRSTGEVLQKEEKTNLIVNNGLERLAKLINGVSSTHYNSLAVGTGTTAATNSDTELESEDQRAEATLSYEADYKAKFEKTFTFLAETDVTEAGIFDSAIVSGSAMLARTTFAAKECSADVDLIVEAIITVSRS